MLIHRPGYGDLPSYKFYVGTPYETTLVFSEPEWRYYKVMPDGSREPQDGVTTVLHATIDRSGPLMAWAVKEAMIRLKALMTERGYVGSSVSELSESALDDIIKKAKTTAKDKLEDAGDVGSQSHEWLETLIKAILKDDDNRRDEILGHFPVDERASNCVIAALDWANRHSVKFLHSERKCFSLKHGVAGTCDAICLTSSCDDNVVAVGWNDLPDLSGVRTPEVLADLYRTLCPDRSRQHIVNVVAQIWTFDARWDSGVLASKSASWVGGPGSCRRSLVIATPEKPLFEAQRFNRIEPRRFSCWVVAEENPYAH